MGENGVIRLQSHQDRMAVEQASGARSNKLILLIDPCTMTRESLQSLLVTHSLAVEAARQVPDRIVADIVLLHIGTDRVDAPETQERIAAVRQRCGGNAGTAVISDLTEPEFAITAVRQGLRGYLPTSLSAGMVTAAVGIMCAGGIFVPTESIAALCMEGAIDGTDLGTAASTILTERERDVLLALEKGNPNKIIAYELKITESTVKVHVRHIMKKLHATNRTQLAFLSRGRVAQIASTAVRYPARSRRSA